MTNQSADDLPLDWNALSCASDSEQQLGVWTVEPGTPSRSALRHLTSWATTTYHPITDR